MVGNLKNNSLIRKKNTKDTMINHKGTRMIKDGEDITRIGNDKLKKN